MTATTHPGWATAERRGKPKSDPVVASAFARALRAAREKRGISQARLAEEADLNHALISRYEAGTRFPSRETAEVLAWVLGDEVMIAAGFIPAGYTAVKIAS